MTSVPNLWTVRQHVEYEDPIPLRDLSGSPRSFSISLLVNRYGIDEMSCNLKEKFEMGKQTREVIKDTESLHCNLLP